MSRWSGHDLVMKCLVLVMIGLVLVMESHDVEMVRSRPLMKSLVRVMRGLVCMKEGP